MVTEETSQAVAESEDLIAVLAECRWRLASLSIRPTGFVVVSVESLGEHPRRFANYFDFPTMAENMAAAVQWVRDLRRGRRS